ncbi:lipopolysaccharide biosynthesis protein [Hirschia litorea]|uniref:Lipopolysaccharide biosynthesis protein n=1 Tax=Hirschia litorea TaxID=1199156 RepID=A0ABW2IPX1_9PROT
MSVSKRIFSGSIVNSAGILMNAFVQLLSFPILVASWGVEQFGVWVLLTTIPTYLALTDLGFIQALTADMALKAAKDLKKEALGAFQSVFWLFIAISVGVIFISFCIFNLHHFVPDRFQSEIILRYGEILFWLAVYSMLTLVSRIPLAGFCSTGNYAIGTFVYDLMVNTCNICMLMVVFFGGGGVTSAVITLLVGRILNTVLFYWFMRYRINWLYYNIDHATIGEIKRLFKPAVSAMLIPLSTAINLQGIVLVIGYVLSPAAVAIYQPVRTASRLAIQVVGIVNRATMPEIAAATAKKSEETLKKIRKLNFNLVIFLLLPGGILFAICGADFVELWSAGQIKPDRLFVFFMALATVFHGIWYLYSNVLLATNSHVVFAKYPILCAIGGGVLTLCLADALQLTGVGIALAVAEGSAAIIILVHINKMIPTKPQ